MTNLGFNVYVKLNLIWEKSQNFGDFPKSNSINWTKKKFSFFNIKTLLFRNLPPFSSLRSVVENTIEVRYLRGKAHRHISCNHLIVKKKNTFPKRYWHVRLTTFHFHTPHGSSHKKWLAIKPYKINHRLVNAESLFCPVHHPWKQVHVMKLLLFNPLMILANQDSLQEE